MPDTYKLPNHITFSDESLYHNEENEGGHWSQLADDRWSFTPGPANLKHHSMQEMRDYFRKYEPDAVFMPGQQFQKGGATQADDITLTDEDRDAAIRYALDHPEAMDPLAALLRPGMKVTIAIDDISLPLPKMSRPDARQSVLTIVLEMLAKAGVDDVHIIIATSFHRRMAEFEIRRAVGGRIFRAYYPDRL